MGMEPPRSQPQLHRITDGDTLEALANRYLGSAARAGEIYEANRELLARPDLLPIGEDLKIPPRASEVGNGEQSTPRPLVPIPPAG